MDNIKDGYYIAPAFMDKLVVHIAKNFMDLPNIKVLSDFTTDLTYNLFNLYTHIHTIPPSSCHIVLRFNRFS